MLRESDKLCVFRAADGEMIVLREKRNAIEEFGGWIFKELKHERGVLVLPSDGKDLDEIEASFEDGMVDNIVEDADCLRSSFFEDVAEGVGQSSLVETLEAFVHEHADGVCGVSL